MKNTSNNSSRISSAERIAPLAYSITVILAVAGSLMLLPLTPTLSKVLRSALNSHGSAPAIPAQGQTATFYLHGTGPLANPPTLFLNTTAPTATSEKYKDSTSINRNGGNPWKEVGAWPATPAMVSGNLASLSDLHVWLGLKNSDDQGTYFDLRVEAYKNSTLVASGQSLCITGITRNPASAKEVVLAFDPFSATAFDGSSDVLKLKVLTRVGTTAAGASCGGHSNAVGLRLYFDATTRPSRFNATQASSDTTPPVLTVEDPPEGLLTNASQMLVKGTYSDASLVTITANGVSATLAGGNFTATVPLSEGQNTINVLAIDAPGNQSAVSRGVTRDTSPPLLTVEQPAEGSIVTQPLLTVSGTFNDSHRTIITINDNLKSLPNVSGNQFSSVVHLVEGSNTLKIQATDEAGNLNEVVRTVIYQVDHTPPNLIFSAPANGEVKQTILFVGSVTSINPPVTVSANGHPLALNPDGSFNGGLALPEGVSEILVQATDANNNETTIARTVTIDTIAPTITELSPAAGALIDSTSVSIQGRITDSTAVTVSVNGIAASIDSAGHFSAQNVPINEGENQLAISGIDAAGNTSNSTLLLVGKDNTPPPAPEVFALITPTRLGFQAIEGRAEPGAQVTITGGAQPVTIDAAFGTGLFVSTVDLVSGNNALALTARDSSGNLSPSVQLSIVSDPEMDLPPAGQPAQINISTGSAQRGLVDTELPRPLIAIVTDQTGTPVAGVAVHFVLKQGGGQFINGGNTADAITDTDGHASVRYISGPQPGLQLIRADYTGNTSTPATFTAEALEPSTSGVTIVSGVVQDQNLRALPNVLVRISGQQTRTGADGRFILNNIPSGPHQLLELIGRDQITLPGRWPNISYDFDVLPAVKNDLRRPLFLPKVNDGIAMPLDANNVVTQDTSFELHVIGGEPPIRVTAKAGTHIIFPPDVTDKRLSVTRLATNRTPMVLEDGRATNLYISVQPSGAIFETPLEVSFPNIDRLPANQEVLLMSFDHDVGRYVRVGTGHVSADGRVVTSDAGSGIRIGAWHALPPDPPQPEVTVLGHIQFEGNPAFEDKLVRVNEAWVEGQQAQLMTAGSSAPRWDYRATLSVAPGTARLAKMEASVVATDMSVELGSLVPPSQPAGVGQSTNQTSSREPRQAHHAKPARRASSRLTRSPLVQQPPPVNSIILAVGQSVEQDAEGIPAPQPGDSYFYSFQSNAITLATVEFATGFNAQSHPNKGVVKGVAPGVTRFSITYSIRCQWCFAKPVNKQVLVTVVGASSIEVELPSTGAGTQRYPTNNRDLPFVPPSGSPLMVVMQNAGPMTIKTVGLNPASAAASIKWHVERNPDDTVATGVPDFTNAAGEQFTVTPNTPGNFRITAFVDTYDDNTRYEGEELIVLRLAIIRVTVQSGHFIEANPEFVGTLLASGNQYSLTTSPPGVTSPPHFTMELQADVLIEGGGHDRMVGVSQVVVGDVGNMTQDTFTVTYPVPNPVPAPPGNVVGTMREIPGAHMPLVDSLNSSPSGGNDPIRSNSSDTVTGAGPGGAGQVRRVVSLDGPGFGWRVRHPTTGNAWGLTRGVNAFRENIVAYSGSFNRNYVALATGDWTVVTDGTNSHGAWVSQGAKVLVQGTTNHRVPMTVLSAQQPAGAAGVQVHGPSVLSLVNNPAGMVYQP